MLKDVLELKFLEGHRTQIAAADRLIMPQFYSVC